MSEIELKTGYLSEEFRIFRIHEPLKQEIASHYHDFHKIILLLDGSGTYQIEGKTYSLLPGDFVLVHAGCIHRPGFLPGAPYDRIILYLRQDNTSLLQSCFSKTLSRQDALVRLSVKHSDSLRDLLLRLFDSSHSQSEAFGSSLLNQALFTEFMVSLNRLYLDKKYKKETSLSAYDPQIMAILTYIREHLCEDLRLETLAEKFYLSRSRLMHKFKEETGYTLHHYILQKRLIQALHLIEEDGIPMTTAALLAGFHDYTSFYRAYTKSGLRDQKKKPAPLLEE